MWADATAESNGAIASTALAEGRPRRKAEPRGGVLGRARTFYGRSRALSALPGDRARLG